MRLETFPLIVGAIVALLGAGLIADGWLQDRPPRVERRRRLRRERNRGGEVMIGLGVVALGAAIAGRDSWRYGILTTLVGAGLVLVGTFMNRSYLKDLVTMRGVSRRRSGEAQATPAPGAPDADRDKGPRRVR